MGSAILVDKLRLSHGEDTPSEVANITKIEIINPHTRVCRRVGRVCGWLGEERGTEGETKGSP